jgi:hypothetical protein
LVSDFGFRIWNLGFSHSGTTRDPQGWYFSPGINPVDALGKGEYTGTTKPIENLMTASLIGDQPGMSEHRQVAGGGRCSASGRRRQFARTNFPKTQGMDNCHPTGMAKRLEYLGLTLECRLRRLHSRTLFSARIALHAINIRFFANYANLILLLFCIGGAYP